MPPEDTAAPAPQISTPGVAPVETPPADQPPKREKNFYERWTEFGGQNLDKEEPDAEETEAETPAAPVLKDKKPAAKAEPPKAEPKPEEEKVTVGERAAFRETKRQHDEWYRSKQAELEKREKELTSTHGERISKAESILKAIEEGDPEGFAQAVGTKDFNEFQESFIKRLADPNYREVKELKEWKAAEQKRKEEEAEQAKQREAQQKSNELRVGYMKNLQETASKSTDKLAAAMHDDGMFLNTVFAVQKANWSDTDQRTVSIEEALDKTIPGTQSTLRGELKKLYDRLSPVFSEPPALAAANGRKPAPKTAVTPARTTDTAGGKGKFNGPNDPAWRKHFRETLAKTED